MNLHELSGVTAPALATTPRSRGRGCKAERLECSRQPCARLRVPCECVLVCVLHGNDSLGLSGRRASELKEVSRDELECLRHRVSSRARSQLSPFGLQKAGWLLPALQVSASSSV